MTRNIEDLINNDIVISSFAQGLIELEDYIDLKKPDICLVPVRGAVPIKDFIIYIQKKKKHDYTNFRYTFLSTERIDESVYNSLHILSKLPKQDFEKLMFTDEVGEGLCWSMLFNAYTNNLFEKLRKIGTKKLLLAGLAKPDKREQQEANIRYNIKATFNLYHKYNCPIVRTLMDLISDIYTKSEFTFAPPDMIEKTAELSMQINSAKDYSKKAQQISEHLAEYCLILEHSIEHDPFEPKPLPAGVTRVMDKLDSLIGKNDLPTIGDKISTLKEKNNKLFNVKETGCEMECKIISCEVPYADIPELIGINKGRGAVLKSKIIEEIKKESKKDLSEAVNKLSDNLLICYECSNETSQKFYEKVTQKIDDLLKK